MRVRKNSSGSSRPSEFWLGSLGKLRSSPRLSLSVLFILLLTAWLIFAGFSSRLAPNLSHDTSSCSTVDPARFRGKRASSASVERIPFAIDSTGVATGLFIFLHGLGDNGAGWCSIFGSIKQKHIRYIFPNAEFSPVTLNLGVVMPSWFDITSLDMSGGEDEKGIKIAAETLRALMKKEQEAAAIPSNRVILGGFSMGGALALYTGLTHPEPLGGLVLLSTWLPLKHKFLQSADGFSLSNQTCPIFQGHGDADTLVQTMFGQATQEILRKARKKAWKSDPAATFKTYKDLGHSSSDKEMQDVGEFVAKHLGPF